MTDSNSKPVIRKHAVNLNRREFLISTLTTGAGLSLAVYLPGCGKEQAKSKTPLPEAGPGKAGGEVVSQVVFEPNAFVRVNTDNSVTVIIKHLEMGQGTYTGLATLVADELDAAWEQIKVESAPADAKRYKNLFWGEAQGTGGSTAIANSFTQMRKAGAAARQMLVNAAAKTWGVPAGEIKVVQGVLSHAGKNKSATFGELAELAAKEPVPQEVFLKSADEFTLIGKDIPRKDSPDKVYAKGQFTQDIKLPGMLTALVAHPPRFGAKLKSFDATQAQKIKGVSEVIGLPNAVAVVAQDFWSAQKGRQALAIQWDESQALAKDSAELMAEFKALAGKPGAVARADGDAASAMGQAASTIKASYEYPYLAHAAMEPMNCVAQVKSDGCTLWYGAQSQTADQGAVAQLLGLKPEQVTIHTLYAGGSFGRRANPHSDYVLEAARIAKAVKGGVPVKTVWTREDDMRAGYYRPMYYHEISAGLDKDGNPTAWQHRIVGQSILQGTFFEEAMIKNGVDFTSVEGANNMPYKIANVMVDLHSPSLPVPVQWWRSVGSTHTAFTVETFIDMLASQAKRDPFEFRKTLLAPQSRELGVLELAASKADWGKPLPAGRGRGIAVHKSFNTYVAEVAEVTVNDDKSFSVDKVVIAVDCGIAVNPDIIRAQMEGGMGFGLAAALSSRITLKKGQVEQSNFHDYEVLRINQMPAVEVHLVQSEQAPTGVGEPATPVIAPAVANALFAVTGQRLFELPLKLSA